MRYGLLLVATACAPAPATDGPATDTRIEPVLVMPDATGLSLRDAIDLQTVFEAPWTDLVGPCEPCLGQGSSPDRDGGLLLSFAGVDGIARLGPDLTVDARLDGFRFPHDVVRDPWDGSLIIVETFADRLSWVDPAATSIEPLRTLDTGTEGFVAVPNGVERIEHDGHHYLLLSHLGRRTTADEAPGRITLWELREDDGPRFVWAFPKGGTLATPHGPILRWIDGSWWLLWAHTRGAPGTGTVGVALTSDLEQVPTYAADLLPGPDIGPLGFLRSVERGPLGALLLVDSGSGEARGRLIRTAWPTLDDDVTTLQNPEVLLDALPSPFEAWLWIREPITPDR